MRNVVYAAIVYTRLGAGGLPLRLIANPRYSKVIVNINPWAEAPYAGKRLRQAGRPSFVLPRSPVFELQS